MIDKQAFALLKTIYKNANFGYKVFDIIELISLVPKEYAFEVEKFNESINTLLANGYISVKYQDDAEICLSILPSGRLVFENFDREKKDNQKIKNRYYLSAFWGSFVGVFTAISVSFALYFLLRGVFNAF